MSGERDVQALAEKDKKWMVMHEGGCVGVVHASGRTVVGDTHR